MSAGQSYAGTYHLYGDSCSGKAWQLFYFRGRCLGAWRGRGGVYAAARHFGV